MKPDEGCRWPPTTWCRMMQAVFLSAASFLVVAQAQSCASTTPLPLMVSNAITVEKCQDVWTSRNFTLRFKQDPTAKTLSILLSVPKQNRWFSIGFNHQQDQMVGSSALVGWVDPTSAATNVTTYYLASQQSSGVRPDNTRLFFKPPGPVLISTQDTLYLTAEIDQAKSTASFDYQILAIGVAGQLPQIDGSFEVHDSSTALAVNFQTGTGSVVQVSTGNLARAHGAVNIFGWGVLLPIGAIIARYAKGYDPAWLYAHAIFQVIGFLFVIAGVATGFRLFDKVTGVDADHHRNLGILIFVLAIWQVSALLIRPHKDTKLRRYWNWGHWWVGRIGLLLAAINVFVGIHVAGGSKGKKAGYASVLAVELVLIIALEIVRWIKYLRQPDAQHLPQVSMQNRSSYEPSNSSPQPIYGTAYGVSGWDDAKY